MEPVIRNVRDMQTPETRSPMMISRDDNPPSNTLLFSEVQPGQSSPHHIHTWEHVVYVVQGSGTMFCDEKAYPIKEGDAVLIPPEVDHYTLNDGGAGNAGGPEPLQRIEVNPLTAGLGGARAGRDREGDRGRPGDPQLQGVDRNPRHPDYQRRRRGAELHNDLQRGN